MDDLPPICGLQVQVVALHAFGERVGRVSQYSLSPEGGPTHSSLSRTAPDNQKWREMCDRWLDVHSNLFPRSGTLLNSLFARAFNPEHLPIWLHWMPDPSLAAHDAGQVREIRIAKHGFIEANGWVIADEICRAIDKDILNDGRGFFRRASTPQIAARFRSATEQAALDGERGGADSDSRAVVSTWSQGFLRGAGGSSSLRAVQSLLSARLNDGVFCGPEGIVVGALPDSRGFWVLGLRASVGREGVPLVDAIGRVVVRLAEVWRDAPRGLREPVHMRVDGEGQRKIRIDGWQTVVDRMAREAVHEGEAVRYRIGVGSAASPFARARVVDHQIPGGTQFFQYVKAHHALIAHSRRILWLTPAGEVVGLFESSDSADGDDWMFNWDDPDYKIAVIDEPGCILVFSGDRRLTGRRRWGVPADVDGLELERALQHALEWILKPATFATYAKCIATSLCNVVADCQLSGVGTAFFVRGDRPATRDSLRLRLDDQCLQLAPTLSEYDGAVLTGAMAGPTPAASAAYLTRRLLPLTRLDGAVVLRLAGRTDPVLVATPVTLLRPTASIKGRPVALFDGKPPYRIPLSGKVDHSVDPDSGRPSRLTLDEVKALIASARRNPHGSPLAFLHSAGTRHHSLWAATIAVKEPCFAVTVSRDGGARVLYDGRVVVASSSSR
ncbi:MAG: hypothetical protein Q8P41_27670 [Pseudomonadota bacterium]|nr:hypothetical protein [Pseudomonadota bacterium]